ncbi:Pre-mRNA-splicing factor cwc26 [Mitosporidium daphniae]
MVASSKAETVYRDPATGRVIANVDEHKMKAKTSQIYANLEDEKRRASMGIVSVGEQGGLVQAKYEAERKANIASLKNLPFYITHEDDTRNKALASIQRWDDPIRYFTDDCSGLDLGSFCDASAGQRQNKMSNDIDIPDSNEAQKGSLPLSSKSKARLSSVYKNSGPPNRFNISPGPLWDGIDRSNGFETKYLLAISSKSAFDEKAYKWSTEDM